MEGSGLPPNVSSLLSLCLKSPASQVIYTGYMCANAFLLGPLFLLTLCRGLRRHPGGLRRPPASCSDLFTRQMMVVELSGVLGSLGYAAGSGVRSRPLLAAGVLLSAIILPGQTLFHLLTCLDRYLAVVHPLAYRRLRAGGGAGPGGAGGASGVAWVLILLWVAAAGPDPEDFPFRAFFSLLGACMLVMGFCCASVLVALLRPGPAGGGGAKRTDPAKRRAFRVTAAITGTLLLRAAGLLPGLDPPAACLLVDAGLWMTVPSSLVLPALALHRDGKSPRRGPAA